MRTPALALCLVLSVALLSACSAQKPANVTIDNQSAAPLQVEVTMPARGMFGRKPCLEGFVTRIEPGQSWESNSDSRRWSMDPNPKQSFRVVAVEHTEQPWVIYEPVWFDTGKTTGHFVLRGRPGAISCQAVKDGGAGIGGEVQLKPRVRTE